LDFGFWILKAYLLGSFIAPSGVDRKPNGTVTKLIYLSLTLNLTSPQCVLHENLIPSGSLANWRSMKFTGIDLGWRSEPSGLC
jgi:hypothetical protein